MLDHPNLDIFNLTPKDLFKEATEVDAEEILNRQSPYSDIDDSWGGSEGARLANYIF